MSATQVAVRPGPGIGNPPKLGPATGSSQAVEQQSEFLAFVMSHSDGQWRVGTSKRLRARK